jgi:hypothetical protein
MVWGFGSSWRLVAFLVMTWVFKGRSLKSGASLELNWRGKRSKINPWLIGERPFDIIWRICQSKTTLKSEKFKINLWRIGEKLFNITLRMCQSKTALEN